MDYLLPLIFISSFLTLLLFGRLMNFDVVFYNKFNQKIEFLWAAIAGVLTAFVYITFPQ